MKEVSQYHCLPKSPCFCNHCYISCVLKFYHSVLFTLNSTSSAVNTAVPPFCLPLPLLSFLVCICLVPVTLLSSFFILFYVCFLYIHIVGFSDLIQSERVQEMEQFNLFYLMKWHWIILGFIPSISCHLLLRKFSMLFTKHTLFYCTVQILYIL